MYPVIFRFGFINFYTYGLMAALGILTAGFLCQKHAVRVGLPRQEIIDLIFWMVIGGIIGGRLNYVVLNFDYYRFHPEDIFKIYEGGLVFYGGLFLGGVSAIVFVKRKGLLLSKTLDVISVYLPLAHAFGRIGCFLNGCCYGKRTDSSLGVFFPNMNWRVYPTQLYSAVLLFTIFLLLFFNERKKKFEGEIFLQYLILYGLMRFFIEFMRGDNEIIAGPFTFSQIVSLIVVVGTAVVYLVRKFGRKC
ncbi:MAG: prolipoprotein diacylglyceryl transferase [Candidatus Omnitrophota bacterium]